MHSRLGQAGLEKILEAATEHICMPDRAFVLFFEAHMLHSDMFDAFVEKRGPWHFPTYFVTACGTEAHYDWWMHTKREVLTK